MDEPILSQSEAIAIAVACNPSHEGMAVLQTAHRLLTGRATAQTLLRDKLDDARSAIAEIDTFIHVCRSALQAEDCDLDTDVAAVLRTAQGRAKVAGDSIEGALGLLREVFRA
jgi:hypothetical protein